ncbi:Hypp4304 [Branchiostoma lanceolatum]|uniref:Hypp4304 protein n=1 Tax=Branchiostoma lanceolatum TaxID=7740 RepID=A0A8K0EVD9_BRALA|nr:Hypp4304 [Branchiostoma lanceolatum]
MAWLRNTLIGAGVVFVFVAPLYTYFHFFHHPPPKDALEANRQAAKAFREKAQHAGPPADIAQGDQPTSDSSSSSREALDIINDVLDDGKDFRNELPEEETDSDRGSSHQDKEEHRKKPLGLGKKENKHKEPQEPRVFYTQSDGTKISFDLPDVSDRRHLQGAKHWDDFIVKNDYVEIGEYWDSCENPTRVLGKATLQDNGNGGIKSVIFFNASWDFPKVEGLSCAQWVKYNGGDMFDNQWEDACELEADPSGQCPYKGLDCPLEKAEVVQREISIPSYTPSGTYTQRSALKDQDGKDVMCTISQFTY